MELLLPGRSHLADEMRNSGLESHFCSTGMCGRVVEQGTGFLARILRAPAASQRLLVTVASLKDLSWSRLSKKSTVAGFRSSETPSWHQAW